MRDSWPVVSVIWVGLATSAQATELSIDPQYGSTENTGVTASLTLEFVDHGDDDFLRITIVNTTSLKLGSKLTAVGLELPDFLIDPPALIPPSLAGYFDELTLNDDFEPEHLNAAGGYDIVLTGDGNFLGGNPQDGPGAGERETVTINLGNTGLSAAELDMAFFNFYAGFDGPFAVGRFQVIGLNDDSDKVGGGLIPEPSSLVLLALGAASVLHRGRLGRR